jgi:two-component system chemotaxis response regulator CheY
MKCLVVDDVEFVREMMAFYLADFGTIDTAADGIEAVECFSKALNENNPYQLVCLDIEMPNMDGQQALKQMRLIEKEAAVQADKKTVIIMTTASTETNDMEEALWEGDSTDYLVKPVSPDDLIAVLKRHHLIAP